MAKKTFLAVVFLFIFSYGVFAGENERWNNNISLSFGIFGAELSYERALNNYLSLLGSVSYTTLVVVNELTASAKGRVYPFTGRVFYLEMGLGVTYGFGFVAAMEDAAAVFGYLLGGLFTFGLLWAVMDPPEPEIVRTAGFLVQPGMGWNIRLGREQRVTLPISMGLNLKLAQRNDFMPFFRIGLGYSF